MSYVDFNTLVGKTLTSILVSPDNDEIVFNSDNGKSYKMYHEQDCCETVEIEDICGNIENLINSPILLAEERTSQGEDYYGTETWTFYEIATNKGSVTIRWYGESNGYYSESVDFIEV